jgi:capsular exopolysaccharide synthesis family protein
LTSDNIAKIKTILFLGTRHGGGCSTITVGFANNLARELLYKILLVDVNLRTPAYHDLFKIDKAQLFSFEHSCESDLQNKVKRVGNENLYVASCCGSLIDPISLFESKQFDHFLQVGKDNFDYVILDGPPVPGIPEAQRIATKVDGVIIIIEAGITRKQVIRRVKKELEDAGANILGVVLNRRKQYIPNWLYRRI